MWAAWGQAVVDAVQGMWGAAVAPPNPVPPEEPPRPGKWDRDPDALEEVCRLQELWCRSDGIDRYWAGRRYRDAVGRLFPHAA